MFHGTELGEPALPLGKKELRNSQEAPVMLWGVAVKKKPRCASWDL